MGGQPIRCAERFQDSFMELSPRFKIAACRTSDPARIWPDFDIKSLVSGKPEPDVAHRNAARPEESDDLSDHSACCLVIRRFAIDVYVERAEANRVSSS